MKILFTTAPPPPKAAAPAKKGATPAPPADDAATLAEKAASGWGGDGDVAYAEPGADGAVTVVDLSTWIPRATPRRPRPSPAGSWRSSAPPTPRTTIGSWRAKATSSCSCSARPRARGAQVAAETLKNWKIAR